MGGREVLVCGVGSELLWALGLAVGVPLVKKSY